jgi:hypothetical protein
MHGGILGRLPRVHSIQLASDETSDRGLDAESLSAGGVAKASRRKRHSERPWFSFSAVDSKANRMRPHAILMTCAAISSMALSGCNQSVDLSAVTKLAATTATSASSFAALSQDLETSCTRTYEWEWVAARSYDGFQSAQQVCAADKGAAAQWQAANIVLLSYIRALGALAGGNDTESDYGIPGLVSGISSVTHSSLSSTQVSGISSVATSLVTDIYNIRRRDEIAKYAPAADKDLDALVAVLEDVAKENYAAQLGFETDSINNFYRPVVGVAVPSFDASGQSAPSSHSSSLPVIETKALTNLDKVQLLQLRDHYKIDRDAIDVRRSGIGAYVAALEAIKNAHTALVESIVSSKSSDVAKIVQSYIDQLGPSIQQLNKATSGGTNS